MSYPPDWLANPGKWTPGIRVFDTDGQVLAPAVQITLLGSGVSVVDDGDGKCTITISGGGGGGIGGSGTVGTIPVFTDTDEIGDSLISQVPAVGDYDPNVWVQNMPLTLGIQPTTDYLAASLYRAVLDGDIPYFQAGSPSIFTLEMTGVGFLSDNGTNAPTNVPQLYGKTIFLENGYSGAPTTTAVGALNLYAGVSPGINLTNMYTIYASPRIFAGAVVNNGYTFYDVVTWTGPGGLGSTHGTYSSIEIYPSSVNYEGPNTFRFFYMHGHGLACVDMYGLYTDASFGQYATGVKWGIYLTDADAYIGGQLAYANPTSGGAAGAGTLTNAPKAGNPDSWLPFMRNGVQGWIPWWHA